MVSKNAYTLYIDVGNTDPKYETFSFLLTKEWFQVGTRCLSIQEFGNQEPKKAKNIESLININNRTSRSLNRNRPLYLQMQISYFRSRDIPALRIVILSWKYYVIYM